MCFKRPAADSLLPTQPPASSLHQAASTKQLPPSNLHQATSTGTMKTLLLLAGLVVFSAAVPIPVPYHAFCRTLWLFSAPCVEVSTKVVQQIQSFNPMFGCPKCHYTLVSGTPVGINANHTSADGLQVENITFTFSPTVLTGGCRVAAQSMSLGFTSLLDNGLNYCNLYDLLSASGLASGPGFMEMTNEWACLGYGLATCKN
ncbi:uncharacterized protein LOC133568980 [Nerophis ophidion]|uniref:uncharacterized protein LOC133568980 n=1 Tax=Nerophis ophidion TaxID=159077 RepID=UPI002ADF14A1|nr:uncharacterized protein LOC133568980 [Nerophis ophidion]